MKRANDDLQYRLSNRAGMKEEKKNKKVLYLIQEVHFLGGGNVKRWSKKIRQK